MFDDGKAVADEASKAETDAAERIEKAMEAQERKASAFSLSDERIKELYPGVEITRTKETPSEMWQRIKRAHSERRKSRVVTPDFKR